jgi:hypothetical protein
LENGKHKPTPLGLRLVVEGSLTLCDGVVAQIWSVWFIESGDRVFRVVIKKTIGMSAVSQIS